jgi:hypothetical protein
MQVIPKLSAFTVDRQTWLRGEGASRSWLLRDIDQKMCCLGSYALACGMKAEQIKLVSGPGSLAEYQSTILEGLATSPHNCTSEAACLMNANDDPHIADTEREAKLTAKFAEMGITVTFIN